MSDFVKALRSGKVLVMDGAMGTELQRILLAPVECGEAYNLANPALVRRIHRSYLDAGADVLLTNTFQANPAALKRRGIEKRLPEIWRAAVANAHLDHPRPHYVLADVGPIEKLTTKIACALLDQCSGVNGVLLETWSSFEDLKRFCDRTSTALLVSFTFQRTRDLLTIRGATPEVCAKKARQAGAVALGANCGKEIGMDDLCQIVKRYHDVCDLPIFIRPNAGTPKRGRRYPRTPETMAAALLPILDDGIAMIGGCCGTTPEHVQAFRTVVDAWNRGAK